ncbi:transporter substrate-binding domain-containing protein [Nakamurella sp.]|uniref:transporter substrate-binding domain-containing protein n=1 Tax=Nakamurella sp. TaxID=1869182 RepID=UPI0037843286
MAHRWGRLIAAVGAAALLVGCATPGSSTSLTTSAATPAAPPTAAGTVVPALPDCASGALPTVTSGTLTIAAEIPGASPWYLGQSPESGQGLDSSVAYALAETLGYGPERVAWVDVDRAQAAAGVAGGFDLALDQFTAPDRGTPTADYSTGYFSVTDALVMRQGGAAAPTSVAGVAALRLGAVSQTPAFATATRVTGSDPVAFGDQQQALAGLAAGAVDGMVLSIPSALAAAQADPGLRVIGQLPSDPMEQPTQFKVLLKKGSALTGCVSAAVDRMRVEGTLEKLAQTWVDPEAPVLR